MGDPVNHPAHYTQCSTECIDVIEELQLPYHLACVFKYIWRHRDKNGIEDLKKAEWYLMRYISIMEEKDAKPSLVRRCRVHALRSSRDDLAIEEDAMSEIIKVETKTEERGWPGHYICADRCLFRRNTLVVGGNVRIVVSTVGTLMLLDGGKIGTVGYNRYYETMAFHAMYEEQYWEADVTREVSFKSPWGIDHCESGTDLEANAMHETVVAEIVALLESGWTGDEKEQGE
jgi:hypothetical protein